MDLNGFPEFQQQALDVNPLAFQAIVDLHPIATKLFSKPVAASSHKVTRMIAKITYNSLGALTMLLLNGYGSDGMKIARSMYEAAITTAYLRKYPGQVDDFLDYHHILERRDLDYLRNQSAAPDIPKTRQAEIDGEYNRVLPRFQGHLTRWYRKKNFYEMVKEVGETHLYPTFYRTASSLIHGDIRSLTTQNEQTLDVDMAPSLRWIKEALLMGHGTVVLTLTAYAAISGHGMDRELGRAGEAYKKAWV